MDLSIEKCNACSVQHNQLKDERDENCLLLLSGHRVCINTEVQDVSCSSNGVETHRSLFNKEQRNSSCSFSIVSPNSNTFNKKQNGKTSEACQYAYYCVGFLDKKHLCDTVIFQLPISSSDDNLILGLEMCPPMESKRYGHSMCLLEDGILAIGGSSGPPLNSVEKYSFLEKKWTTFPNMHLNRSLCASCRTEGNHVVVCGGSEEFSALRSVEMYDFTQNAWITLPHMRFRRHSCAAVAIGNDIYVFGGRNEPGNHGCFYKHGEKLCLDEQGNCLNNSWTTIASMKQQRFGCAAAALNGLAYVVGGTNGVRSFNSVEIYCPITDQWREGPSMNDARAWCTLHVWKDCLVVVGGYDSVHNLKSVNTVEIWEIAEQGGHWKIIGLTPRLGRNLMSEATGNDKNRTKLSTTSHSYPDNQDALDNTTCTLLPNTSPAAVTQLKVADCVFASHRYSQNNVTNKIRLFDNQITTKAPLPCEMNKTRLIPMSSNEKKLEPSKLVLQCKDTNDANVSRIESFLDPNPNHIFECASPMAQCNEVEGRRYPSSDASLVFRVGHVKELIDYFQNLPVRRY